MTHQHTAGRRALGVAALVSAGLALAAIFAVFGLWDERVIVGDSVCGAVVHWHPGSSYVPSGGEQTVGGNRATHAACDPAGASAWHAGELVGLVAIALTVLAVACTLTWIRRLRHLPATQ